MPRSVFWRKFRHSPVRRYSKCLDRRKAGRGLRRLSLRKDSGKRVLPLLPFPSEGRQEESDSPCSPETRARAIKPAETGATSKRRFRMTRKSLPKSRVGNPGKEYRTRRIGPGLHHNDSFTCIQRQSETYYLNNSDSPFYTSGPL